MPLNTNPLFNIRIDNSFIEVTLNIQGKSLSVKRAPLVCRNYIIANYNWNGILKLMRFLYKKHGASFEYPDQLAGTIQDDELLIPDQAIAFVLNLQMEFALKKHQQRVDKMNTILKSADGKPGNGFCRDILKKDRLAFLNESFNKTQKDPDTGKKMLPPANDAPSSEFYNFFKKIVQLRNGIWSTKPNVVNLIGLRRVIVANRAKDAGYNDTIASCWIDDQGQPQCALNIATTEPGSRLKARELFPQTMTLTTGYHKLRQPGGRTRNALKEGSSRNINLRKDQRFNDKKPEWCSGDTTMNFHQGGNNFLYPSKPGLTGPNAKRDRAIWLSRFGLTRDMQQGMPSAKADQETLFQLNLVLSEIYWILSKYGKDRVKPPYENLHAMLGHPPISRTAIDSGKIKIQQAGQPDKVIDIARAKVVTLKIWFDGRRNEATKKKIYEILAHVSDYHPKDIQSWHGFSLQQVLEKIKDEHILNLIDIQIAYSTRIKEIDGIAGNNFYAMISGIWQKISDAKKDKVRLDALLDQLDDLPLRKSIKTMFKKSMRIRTHANRINVRDNTKHLVAKDIDVVADVVVGNYSAGCQVFFDTEVFYAFWTKLLQRAQQSGQRRWYYTLVDATNFRKSDVL